MTDATTVRVTANIPKSLHTTLKAAAKAAGQSQAAYAGHLIGVALQWPPESDAISSDSIGDINSSDSQPVSADNTENVDHDINRPETTKQTPREKPSFLSRIAGLLPALP